MEGKKFSSSHGIVIYVRDFLQRYQADALRYFICAAGPETADADFTWAEFVRRTNGELVAGWGNLVNRTASMIHKRFGAVPAPGELEDPDRALLDAIETGFDTVGGLIASTARRPPWPRPCAWWGRPTSTWPTPSPSSSRARTPQPRPAKIGRASCRERV